MLHSVNLLDIPIFSSFNCFNILPEEHLFSLTLSPILSSSRKYSCCHLCSQSDLRSTLKISYLAVFGPFSPYSFSLFNIDLGSKEPLTLPIIINNSLSASSLMDSGTSSQFIDINYTRCINLEMTLKPESQDMILADGKPSPMGKIIPTYIL